MLTRESCGNAEMSETPLAPILISALFPRCESPYPSFHVATFAFSKEPLADGGGIENTRVTPTGFSIHRAAWLGFFGLYASSAGQATVWADWNEIQPLWTRTQPAFTEILNCNI